jgi:hypothetical protein
VPHGLTLDGVSLGPVLLEGKPLPARTLFWGYNDRFAARQGSWKLVVNQPSNDAGKAKAKKKETAGAMLFNLANDLGEKSDLSAKEPQKVRQLQAALAAWRKDVAPR